VGTPIEPGEWRWDQLDCLVLSPGAEIEGHTVEQVIDQIIDRSAAPRCSRRQWEGRAIAQRQQAHRVPPQVEHRATRRRVHHQMPPAAAAIVPGKPPTWEGWEDAAVPPERLGEYVGGVLAPGIEISMDALFARAARLVKVDYAAPESVIGKTTVAGLQSGLVYGFAGQVDGIVKAIRGELGSEAPTVATGGLAELIVPHTRTIERIDQDLTLEGLRLLWALNA
jgi:hypothetical protein